MHPDEHVNAYKASWIKLRKKLDDAAAEMPDGSESKKAVLQVIFMMNILEPDQEQN